MTQVILSYIVVEGRFNHDSVHELLVLSTLNILMNLGN